MSRSHRPCHLRHRLWAQATWDIKVPCFWCKTKFHFDDLTADHEPALAENGRPKQAVLACLNCNQIRGKETNRRVKAKRSRGKNHKRRKRR